MVPVKERERERERERESLFRFAGFNEFTLKPEVHV